MKRTVLITGASSGIGYELAKEFAGRAYDLVITSRSEDKLNKISKELNNKYGCNVKAIAKDLTSCSSAKEIFDEIIDNKIEINVLVNNAGMGSCGLFHETDYKKDMDMINVNLVSLTNLTKLFANDMIERGGGKILNIASTGAYEPGPNIAVYYATKAYVLSFSEALYNELKDFGINVITICPGATKTEFAQRTGQEDLKNAMSASVVARIAYKAMEKNKRVVIPGITNKIAVFMTKIIPRNISAKIIRKVKEKQLIN